MILHGGISVRCTYRVYAWIRFIKTEDKCGDYQGKNPIQRLEAP